jgi:hypothetical protein
MLGWQLWRLALFDAVVAAYGLAWRKTDGLGRRHRVWRKGAAWTGLGWAGLIHFIYLFCKPKILGVIRYRNKF